MSAATLTGVLAAATEARAAARARVARALAVDAAPDAADLAHVDTPEAAREVEREADRLRGLRAALPLALKRDAAAADLAAAVEEHRAAVHAAGEAERAAGLKATTGAGRARALLAAREGPAAAFTKLREAERALAPADAALRRALALAGEPWASSFAEAQAQAERASSRLRAAERALAPLEDVGALDRLRAGVSQAVKAISSAVMDLDPGRRARAEREVARLRGEVEAREAPSFSEKIAAARVEVQAAREAVAATAGGPAAILRDLAASVGLEVPGGEAPAAKAKRRR